MCHENIKSLTAPNNSHSPTLNYINAKIRVKFDGSCLKQDKLTYTHKAVVNIYIMYEINLWQFKRNADFTLGNSLFGAAKLTKNLDFDIYKYSGYGIGFGLNETFLLSNGCGFGKNVMSSSEHIGNKKKNILILGKGPTQGLDDTTLPAEKGYL